MCCAVSHLRFNKRILYVFLIVILPLHRWKRVWLWTDELVTKSHPLQPHLSFLVYAFALRTLHTHGLSGRALWTVTQAHIISRFTYACSMWWGFCNSGERDQLAAVVTRLAKKNYLPPDQPTLHEMVATADAQLFNQVVANPTHVLAPLIPPSKSHSHNLRKCPHDLQIPSHKTNILD